MEPLYIDDEQLRDEMDQIAGEREAYHAAIRSLLKTAGENEARKMKWWKTVAERYNLSPEYYYAYSHTEGKVRRAGKNYDKQNEDGK